MPNRCTCIAIVPEESSIIQVVELINELGVKSKNFFVVNKKIQSHHIDDLLTKSNVPEGSRFCYQCLLEMGQSLLVIQGDLTLIETVGRQLEKFNDIDISIHLDMAPQFFES